MSEETKPLGELLADDKPQAKMFPIRPKKGVITEPSLAFRFKDGTTLEFFALRAGQILDWQTSSVPLRHCSSGPSISIRTKSRAAGMSTTEYDVDSPLVWGYLGRLMMELERGNVTLVTMTDEEYNTEKDNREFAAEKAKQEKKRK